MRRVGQVIADTGAHIDRSLGLVDLTLGPPGLLAYLLIHRKIRQESRDVYGDALGAVCDSRG